MTSTTTGAASYTRVAVTLHWFLAVTILAGFTIGLWMADEPVSPTRGRWIHYHKWSGITILAFSVFRLVWRIGHQPPQLPESVRPWQRAASKGVHRALYLFFFIVPVVGWAYSSALGFHVVYLGLIRLPDLAPKDKALAETLIEVHAQLAWTLAALVGLHVVAALKHHWIDRDGLLRRMWSWRTTGPKVLSKR